MVGGLKLFLLIGALQIFQLARENKQKGSHGFKPESPFFMFYFTGTRALGVFFLGIVAIAKLCFCPRALLRLD